LRLLVSCCNVGGALFHVELRGRDPRVRRVLPHESTGLAYDAGRALTFVAFPDGVRAFDRRMRPAYRYAHRLPGADVHDIKVCDEGLAVVETGANRLAVYNAPGKLAWEWRPSPGEGDRAHLNSALLYRGSWLTSMFSPEGLGEPWRERTDGAVVRLPGGRVPAVRDAPGGEIIVRGLQQPHSLLDVDGQVWLCESRRRRVIRLGEAGEPPAVVADLPAYARGLAVTKRYVVVGQSRSDAHFVKPLVGEDAPARDAGMCGLWFIPRDGGERFFVELPAMEVYDILPLPR
jgi:hypothetical protein